MEEFSSADFKKYLNKLQNIITNGCVFSFFKSKLVNKNKIDDILCCIEASWPKEYQSFIKKYGASYLKCPKYYGKLLEAIKNKWLFSTSHYLVNYKKAESAIKILQSYIDTDIKKIMDMS